MLHQQKASVLTEKLMRMKINASQSFSKADRLRTNVFGICGKPVGNRAYEGIMSQIHNTLSLKTEIWWQQGRHGFKALYSSHRQNRSLRWKKLSLMNYHRANHHTKEEITYYSIYTFQGHLIWMLDMGEWRCKEHLTYERSINGYKNRFLKYIYEIYICENTYIQKYIWNIYLFVS